MASRYDVLDYIKKNHSNVAGQFEDDKSLYEWARKRYLPNYPSWDEVDTKVNINEADTANFKQPKNQIQESSLEQEDVSPEKFGWLERFLTYGGMAEEALGKGVLPEGANILRGASQAMGVDDDYWENAYNNSMAGLMYSAFTGKDKYTVEDYHDGGVKGAIIDGSSFVMGMMNPVDAMLFAVSGGAGKAGTALAEAGIKRTFFKKGMDANVKALAGNRPFLRSMISQGVGTSASLGTFFSAQGAVAESSRQSKAIRAGEMKDFDTGEIINKAVEHGKEGMILGGAIGVGIGGGLGTRYGQLILKSKAEGKNLTRFENIQKALTHPIPRVGFEGALFTLGGNMYMGEDAPSLGSPEWWEQFIHSTTVIAGLKMSGKLWGKALGKEPSAYGEEADRILMEGLKDAHNFSDGMEKSLKGVKANIGDLDPRVKDVLDSHITEAEIKSRKGLGEGDAKFAQKDLNEMKNLFSEFREKGAEIGGEKMKRLVELSTEYENMLKSIVDDMIADPTKAYDIMSKVKVKKFLTETDKKQVDKYLNDVSEVLTQIQTLRNAPTNGGINIPKEGINTNLKSNEVPLDGTTNTSVNKDDTVKIFSNIDADAARREAGAPTQGEPILTEIKETVTQIKEKLPTAEGTISEAEFSTKQAIHDKVMNADLETLSSGEARMRAKINMKKNSQTGEIVKGADNTTKVAFIEWGASEMGRVASGNKYVVGAEKLVKFLSDRKKSVNEMTTSDINEFLVNNAKSQGAIQGVRSFVTHLKENKYISTNTFNNVKDLLAKRHAELQWEGQPGEPGSRAAAIKEGTKLGKDYETLAELTSYYGVRDAEANRLRRSKGELIKQDKESGEWFIDFTKSGELKALQKGRKIKTVPRVIWLDGKFAKKLKSHLETAEPIAKDNWTTKLNKALKPIFGKSQAIKDVRKRLEARAIKLTDAERRDMKWMHGHEIKKMSQGYEGKPLAEFLLYQKSIREKMDYKGFGTPSVTKETGKLKVGDIVQWTSQGVDQFAKPRKITKLINGHATVEGSNTGIPLKELSRQSPQKRIATRKAGEVIFKSKAERDVALKDFMARNKMTPESLKEAKLGKNEMGEFLDGAVKLAQGKWQPIDFFHENAHRLKYYAKSSNNKKILNMFKQGEKLAKGSKEYKDWLAKNKDVKNPVEEFFTDVIAGEGVAREFNKGFVNKVKQFVNRMVSSFKVAFNKGDYKDIARVLAKPVQKGFVGKGGIKTGVKKFRTIEGEEISAPKEYVKAIKLRLDKMIEKYNPSVQDKAEIVKIIAEDAGLKDFKLSGKSSIEDLGIFYNHFVKNIPIEGIPKKVEIASWFRNYRTTENARLKANVSKEAQKGWLEALGVSEGNIFRANVEQLKSYQAILHTMKYEKRSDVDWIDSKLMAQNVSPEIRAKFQQYGGLKQGAFPVHMVFEGMGLKKLARKMIDHVSIEQGHIGTWIDFENDSKAIVGRRKWDKYKEFLYLLDRERYVQRRDAGKLSRAEKNFIDNSTTLAWRNGTDKSIKNMFSNTSEGKLGEKYVEYMDKYPSMLNDVLSLHMNPAELQKWKENNNVRWVKGKVYVHRGLTDKFKKLYDPRGLKYQKFVEGEAKKLATKWAEERHGKNYTKEQYSEAYDNAMTTAWSELSDMFSFSGERYSSKFLEKRHIKLPEFVEINGKKVQVYETAYDKTVTPYATGMAKLFANLEVFPEFVKLKGFKVSDVKEVLGKLEAIDPKHGKWVKDQINVRLGIGQSPTGDIASTFVRFSQKYATALAKLGLSFPTAGLKNITVGNTQTLLAFKVSDFTRGLWETIGRDARRDVKRTGATELGLRHHEEIKTFKWLDDKVFWWGGMKPTENINRYISVLAGKHDQNRGVDVLQRYGSDSRKYKRVAERFKRFYYLSNKEIGLIEKYGRNGVKEREFKSTVEKAQIGRELDRIYQKMDTLAHINTQGASADVFMPYWWNKGYVRPYTLYKRMAYAATFNTARNIKDAWKGRNFMKLSSFMFGTYFTGETLMGIQNAFLGTPFPTKDDEGLSRLSTILWKSEFMGILSELNRGFSSYDQIGFQLYPSILKNAEDLFTTTKEVSDIWFDMENVDPKVKLEFTGNTLEDYLSKTVSLWGNTKKLIMNKKSKYNTEYRQQKTYFREFAKEMDLSSNVEMDKHTTNYYWDLFENGWNRSYMTGDKENFQRVFWTTFWGIANDYHLRGSDEDGIPLRTRDEAIKEAAKNMKSKIKALNPNKYTLTKKSKMGKIKGIKYRLWLGDKKARQLDSLEAQYWKHYREWWGRDISDSMSAFYLTDMAKYFK